MVFALGTFVDHICKEIEAELGANDLLRIISFCESLLEEKGIDLVSRIQPYSGRGLRKAA
jgi:hypothetical protein